MGCLIRVAGVAAILVGIGLFVFWMTDVEASTNILETVFCDEDETFVRKYTTDDEGTSMDVYCQDQNGRQQNVTLQALLIILGLSGSIIVGGYLMAKSGTGIFPQFRPKVTLDQMAAGQTYGLNRVAQVTFTQDTYTAQEVERKMVQLRQLLQSGMLTQEQFEEISAELSRRQI